MNILLIYHNFLRDYRGLLLLAEVLRYQGHNVWIRAHWRSERWYSKIKNVDVIVTGQIAESSTHGIADFALEHKIRLVINNTENFERPERFYLYFIYKNDECNEKYIDLQNIATQDVYEYVLKNDSIINKEKYQFIGFPRFDITYSPILRDVETRSFEKKYGLSRYKKRTLYISSFLFESAFQGISEGDAKLFDLEKFLATHKKSATEHVHILQRLLEEKFTEDEALIIKKHPWDCSTFFKDFFSKYKNCIVLDNYEYITPCLTNVDFVIHKQSTVAVEAWLLDKKTISLITEENTDEFVLNHMQYELVAKNYDELVSLMDNYPKDNPSKKSLYIFGENLDGRATIRFANAINKLKPHPEKTQFNVGIRNKLKCFLEDFLEEKGLKKFNPYEFAAPNTKGFDFFVWENQRAVVYRMYKKAIKEYIKANKKYIEI